MRTLDGHVSWIVCSACQHAVEANHMTLIVAGWGDVPVMELRFQCGACGSRNAGIIVSGALTGKRN